MFKDIPGYEGKYSIDEFGNILSFNYGKQKLLKQGKDKDGYSSIGLHKNNKGTTKKVHRLVALTFLPNPDSKPYVNHKNGIKHDNRLENLEWVTASENQLHSTHILGNKTQFQINPFSKGKFGKDHQCSKPVLQYSDDLEFIREWSSASEASRELGINRGNITSCCLGIRWHKTTGGFFWKFKY